MLFGANFSYIFVILTDTCNLFFNSYKTHLEVVSIAVDILVNLELVLFKLKAFIFFLLAKEAFELFLVTIVEAVMLVLVLLFTFVSVDGLETRQLFTVERSLNLWSSFFEADLFCLKFGTCTSLSTFESTWLFVFNFFFSTVESLLWLRYK